MWDRGYRQNVKVAFRGAARRGGAAGVDIVGGGAPPPPRDSYYDYYDYDYDCSAGWTSVRQPHLVNSHRFLDHNYTKQCHCGEDL